MTKEPWLSPPRAEFTKFFEDIVRRMIQSGVSPDDIGAMMYAAYAVGVAQAKPFGSSWVQMLDIAVRRVEGAKGIVAEPGVPSVSDSAQKVLDLVNAIRTTDPFGMPVLRLDLDKIDPEKVEELLKNIGNAAKPPNSTEPEPDVPPSIYPDA